jgi:hypothetical protein
MSRRAKRIAIIAPLAILGMVVFAFLGGTIVRLLWNWLAPALFGWQQITFWQALGLLALCRILFGGFGMRGGPSSGVRHRMRERWQSMSPEERERLRQRMRDRCGFGPSAGESTST